MMLREADESGASTAEAVCPFCEDASAFVPAAVLLYLLGRWLAG